jgi:hypothetical protein
MVLALLIKLFADKLVHLTVEGKAKPITLHLHSPKERDDLIVAYAKANTPVAKK